MRSLFVLALGTAGILAASGANAQMWAQGRSDRVERGWYGAGDARDGPSSSLHCLIRESDGKRICRTAAEWRDVLVTCLTRKSDGEKVCHSYVEWTEIARQMKAEKTSGSRKASQD